MAIVDAFGYSTAEADLATYRSYYKLPPCTTANGCFRKVNQTGQPGPYPVDDTGWAEETALDLDAVSAACANCHLLLVEADSANGASLAAAVDTAVRLGAKYVSNSYGLANEDPNQGSIDGSYTHQGVTITASSGDDGNIQSFPSTSPHVVAVGGTTLAPAQNTRGWDETTWNGTGSGCSVYEARPDYQRNVDTACAKRAVVDIAADADPQTGLAIYNSLGSVDPRGGGVAPGWNTFGGTSLSSPLIAGMYALSGLTPASDDPSSVLYANQGRGLNDVVSGSNDADTHCGTVLCVAGLGWDGPSGWGTPNGLAGLGALPAGTLTGVVSAGGSPVPSTTITLTGGGRTYTAITDATGHYSVALPAGTYGYTTDVYFYEPATGQNIRITTSATTTSNITLTPAPKTVLSGTVRDASGHGWPLYAKVTIDGYPGGPVWTDPVTGRFSVTLPGKHDYTAHTTAVSSGYSTDTRTITFGAADVQVSIGLKTTIGADLCSTAPGYGYATCEDFDGWSGPQDGWSVGQTATSDATWAFSNFLGVAQDGMTYEGGTAYDIPFLTSATSTDAYLAGPTWDLSDTPSPRLQFGLYQGGGDLDVQLSTDAGLSWRSLIHETPPQFGAMTTATVPISQAAGHSDVRVRFHFVGSGGDAVVVDNVAVGPFTKIAGGLVVGYVRDANTGIPANDVTVADHSDPAVHGTSHSTPDDPGTADGLFTLFEPHLGNRPLTAAKDRYTTTVDRVDIAADVLTHHDLALTAGQLTTKQAGIAVTQTLGGTTTTPVTVTNTGTATLKILGVTTQEGAFTPQLYPNAGGPPAATPAAAKLPSDAPGWQALPDLPEPVINNATGSYRGNLYTFNGNEDLKDDHGHLVPTHNYVYRPAKHAWSRIADTPVALVKAQGAFVNGIFYITSGLAQDPTNDNPLPLNRIYAYDPVANSWSSPAAIPNPTFYSGIATLKDKVYVVAGCELPCATERNGVSRFDTASKKWTTLAPYPVAVDNLTCGTLTAPKARIICTGGFHIMPVGPVNDAVKATYAYDPTTNTWTAEADLPVANFGMSSASSGGQFQVIGGWLQDLQDVSPDKAVYQYDPLINVWNILPSTLAVHGGGGGACGLYVVGGKDSSATSSAEALPGYDQCGTDDVSWLSQTPTSSTLRPGQSGTVYVTVDSSMLTTPGTYQARLNLITDAPLSSAPVLVTLTAQAPQRWAVLTGTITDNSTHAVLANATVTVCTLYDPTTSSCRGQTYTLTTDAHGNYRVWLDSATSPLQIIATAPHHQPAVRIATLNAGQLVSVSLSLHP